MEPLFQENWINLLSDSPRIAPDVTFRVTEEILVDGAAETRAVLIGAHKFVLAMASDVFIALFYGRIRDKVEELHITGVTVEAFQDFLGLIYSLFTSNCTVSSIGAHCLTDVLHLCEEYGIEEAIVLIRDRMQCFHNFKEHFEEELPFTSLDGKEGQFSVESSQSKLEREIGQVKMTELEVYCVLCGKSRHSADQEYGATAICISCAQKGLLGRKTYLDDVKTDDAPVKYELKSEIKLEDHDMISEHIDHYVPGEVIYCETNTEIELEEEIVDSSEIKRNNSKSDNDEVDDSMTDDTKTQIIFDDFVKCEGEFVELEPNKYVVKIQVKVEDEEICDDGNIDSQISSSCSYEQNNPVTCDENGIYSWAFLDEADNYEIANSEVGESVESKNKMNELKSLKRCYVRLKKIDASQYGILEENNQKVIPNESSVYLCNDCDFKTQYKLYLGEHVQAVHKESRHPSHGCDYETNSKCNLETPMKEVHEGSNYFCEKCEYETECKHSIKLHIQATHEKFQAAYYGFIFSCDKCGFKTKYKDHLTHHIQIVHEGNINFCEKM